MNHVQIGADHLLVEISIASALSALACGLILTGFAFDELVSHGVGRSQLVSCWIERLRPSETTWVRGIVLSSVIDTRSPVSVSKATTSVGPSNSTAPMPKLERRLTASALAKR